jgi:hypothetical protein
MLFRCESVVLGNSDSDPRAGDRPDKFVAEDFQNDQTKYQRLIVSLGYFSRFQWV